MAELWKRCASYAGHTMATHSLTKSRIDAARPLGTPASSPPSPRQTHVARVEFNSGAKQPRRNLVDIIAGVLSYETAVVLFSVIDKLLRCVATVARGRVAAQRTYVVSLT